MMDEDQLLKVVTATFAAPMIKSAIDAAMNHVELGGDGKISDESANQVFELANWYAKKFLATR